MIRREGRRLSKAYNLHREQKGTIMTIEELKKYLERFTPGDEVEIGEISNNEVNRFKIGLGGNIDAGLCVLWKEEQTYSG